MTPALQALAVYSGQVALIVAVATAAAWAGRVRTPHARLWLWRATGLLCLALPFLQVRPASSPIAVTFGPADTAVAGARALPAENGLGAIIAAVVAAGVAWRLLRLGLGLMRLRRLRRDAAPAVLEDREESLRATVAPQAELRWTSRLAQPVAFGLRRPVILLPRTFTALAPDARHAVLCHELLHVARRDWPWIVVEDAFRAVLWFHPGVWWLLDQLHLSREQVVDRLVVQRTGARRPYMEALLWYAEAAAAPLPATAFLVRRHLRLRLQHLSQESHMSLMRLAITTAVLVVVLGGASRVIATALPLDLAGLGPAQSPTARFEIRLAELTPAPGLTPAQVDGSTQAVYLTASPLVTTADVTGARVVDAGAGRSRWTWRSTTPRRRG